MALGLRSIRGRIIYASILLLALLLGAALYLQVWVDRAAEQSRRLMDDQARFMQELADLKGGLYSAEAGLYQYAVLLREEQRQAVEAGLEQALRHTARLESLAGAGEAPQLHQFAETLDRLLQSLQLEVKPLLQVITDGEARFPASPLIIQKMYPANIRFTTAVDGAIEELRRSPRSAGDGAILQLLHDMRYYWVQQIAVVRVYVASRSGAFGITEGGLERHLANRRNYQQLVTQGLERLTRLEASDQLDLLQSVALQEMRAAQETFDRYFEQVVEIYESGQWRADVPIMRQEVEPLFSQVWEVMGGAERHLAEMGSANTMEALSAADMASRALWLITGFAALVLLLGGIAYEYLIRRPIFQVVDALHALGRGDSYTPLVRTRAKETERLLEAFRGMQEQVYTREMRLRAILDHASEGIITINKVGKIETFNNAAESLFGFSAEEVMGRNVSLLMPHPMREEHDDYIRRYLESGEQRVINNEINVNAQRKDGTVFPAAIKVSEMVLEGEPFFTALVEDISERKAMLDNLRQLAEHDSLTGLYNRQYFMDELERVVERNRRQHGLDCALLYIDLDNFKYVNDTLGHLAGDKVLVEVAQLIAHRSRKSDLVARLGGDEFSLLLFDVDEAQALQTADDYRRQLAEYMFRHNGKLVDIGCSIGIAMLEDDVDDKEDLLARADISCHMAKHAGRNSVHLYEQDDQVRMDSMYADMGWARTIKHAIEHNRFTFALQPIIDVESGGVVSHEVLLRMLGEGDEIIMPAGFMPAAERFGLLLDIDHWVIRHAIELLTNWPVEHGTPHISINISAQSVNDPTCLDLVIDTFRAFSVDPSLVTFEITETVAIADLGAASEFMDNLRILGCRTALDDFGVGYCSFAYLKDLPADYIKIDGSFVQQIHNNALQLAMVKSMNEIAHAMGKKTVAEYVEDERILKRLREIGVDYVQGYLLGRPELVAAPGEEEAR